MTSLASPSLARPSFARTAPRIDLVAHDEEGLKRVLVALTPELHKRARVLTRNVALADDLVQDTLIRALRFASYYQPGTSVRAWAQQILFHIFASDYRKKKRERRALGIAADDPSGWMHEPVAGPMLRDLCPRLRATLDQVPAVYREVVEQIDLGERSYREVAEAMDIPLGTVMSRLHRGRRLLASSLRPSAKAA